MNISITLLFYIHGDVSAFIITFKHVKFLGKIKSPKLGPTPVFSAEADAAWSPLHRIFTE